MHELGLQLLQARLGLLPLGQIADESREEALAARAHLTDRKLHRERRAVLALADDDAADADDPPLAGPQIAREIAVVILAIGRRHQPVDVGPEHLAGGIAEQALGCGAERLDETLFIDDDHRVGNGVEDRFEVCLPGERIRFAGEGTQATALQLLANPRNANADQRKDDIVKDLRGPKHRVWLEGEKHDPGAERGGKEPRTQPADAGRDQDRRDEEQVGGLDPDDRQQLPVREPGHGHGQERNAIVNQRLASRAKEPRRAGLAADHLIWRFAVASDPVLT